MCTKQEKLHLKTNMAKLSVVATPIGNLEDITARALRVLREADIVACENVAHTRKLLSHFDIHTPAVSDRKALSLLVQGKHVALVCDAGTPGVSDPGGELVAQARAQGAHVEVVPGPSALAAAFSIAGLRTLPITFWGFAPQKKGREKLFETIATSTNASMFFESPHRILKMLNSVAKYLQNGRRVGLYRELTKIHEEVLVGTPQELLRYLEENPEKQRGEFVVIVEST